MGKERGRFRRLPPSAVPVTATDLAAGLRPPPDAHEAFRAAVAAYYHLPKEACYLASSGRTVLHGLLKGLAAEAEGRRQVVMPAYTCPVVAKVTLDLGLQPVYVDIWPESTRYKQEQLIAALSEQTLALFLVHPFGIPLPLEDVWAPAKKVGAVVIEDAAQAMGAHGDGRPLGLGGDFGLFSLGPGKPLSTGGGGIVITGHKQNQAALARWWAELPSPGGGSSARAWLRQLAFQIAFHPRTWWAATSLGVQRMGNQEASWGYRLCDLSSAQAAVGLALLPRLDEINARRTAVSSRVSRAVEKTSSVQNLAITPKAEPIFLRLPVLAASESERERLYGLMWAAGIGAGRLYEKTLPAIFEPRTQDTYPGADAFARRLLTLPTHYHVSEDDIALMAEILRRF